MCGLVGYSGHNGYDSDTIATLMLLNMDRGLDASGFYKPIIPRKKRNTNYVIEKDSDRFCKKLVYDSDLHNHTSKVFIGHCRQSSYGAKTKENAHPFIYNNESKVVLAHNGTLTDLYDLREFLRNKVDKKYNNLFDYNEVSVDSKIFPLWFSIKGIEDSTVLEYYSGAAALLFSEAGDQNVLYAYTDHSRPLHYGFIDNEMYISSEKDPLEYVGCTKITQFPLRTVCKIKNGEIISKKKINEYAIPKKSYNNSYGYSETDYNVDYSKPNVSVVNQGFIKHKGILNFENVTYTQLNLKLEEVNTFVKYLNDEEIRPNLFYSQLIISNYKLLAHNYGTTVEFLMNGKYQHKIAPYEYGNLDVKKSEFVYNKVGDVIVYRNYTGSDSFYDIEIGVDFLRNSYKDYENHILDQIDNLDELKENIDNQLTKLFELTTNIVDNLQKELSKENIDTLNKIANEISKVSSHLSETDEFSMTDLNKYLSQLRDIVTTNDILTMDSTLEIDTAISKLRDYYYDYTKDLENVD